MATIVTLTKSIIGSLVLLMTEVAFAQTQPKTPYKSTPTLAEVERIRDLSDKTRKLRNFQPTSDFSARTIFEVGFGYCTAEGVADEGYSIANGGAAVRLGDVQSLTITNVGEKSLHIVLGIMPTITVAALLSERPSFSALQDNHGRHLDFDIPKNKDNGRPCITGKAKDYDDNRTFRMLLEKLPLQRTFHLQYDANNVWWAIPSVVADPKYPYRVGFDAFGEAIKVRDR